MDLSPTTTTTSYDSEKAWLASKHGTDSLQTVTLDIAGGTFDAVIVDGIVPSGVGLTPNVDGITYRNVDSDDVAAGHLWEPVITKGGDTVGGSLFWHGLVVQAQVPDGTGVALAGAAFANANRAPHIRYV